MNWRERAACRDYYNPEWWFTHSKGNIRSAKLVCSVCPVADECLLYAYETKQQFGIWGGLTTVERRRLLRRYSLDNIYHERARLVGEAVAA